MKVKGVVKWWSDSKGYGFIGKDGENLPVSQDIFVHYSAIDSTGAKTLKEGEPVEFELNETARGPEAKNVKKVE